jgi:hypothetical protein
MQVCSTKNIIPMTHGRLGHPLIAHRPWSLMVQVNPSFGEGGPSSHAISASLPQERDEKGNTIRSASRILNKHTVNCNSSRRQLLTVIFCMGTI